MICCEVAGPFKELCSVPIVVADNSRHETVPVADPAGSSEPEAGRPHGKQEELAEQRAEL